MKLLGKVTRNSFSEWRRALAIIGALFLVVIVPVIVIVMRKPAAAEAAWFDNSWGFRQRIPLANSSGSNQTDFQVQLTYDTSTPIAAGKIQATCADIRFTDNNGKVLPYWIEPGTCGTTTSKIWVKVPSIPNGGGNIYIYYGNAQATAQGTTRTTDVFIREVPNLLVAYNLDEASWNGTAGEIKDTSGNGKNMFAAATNSISSGGNTSTTLNDTAANWTVNAFSNDLVTITGGTGNSQTKAITSNTTTQLTVSTAWSPTPDSTSTYRITPTTTTGKFGNAGNFNGVTDYATLNAGLGTLLTGKSAITAMAWINPSKVTGVQRFLSLNPPVFLTLTNNKLGDASLVIHTTANGFRGVLGTASYTTGSWQHMAVTYDGSTIRLFTNGVADGSTAQNGVFQGPGCLEIGHFNAGSCNFLPTNYVQGLIDDVFVFDRALTGPEITDIYGSGGNNEPYTTTNYPSRALVRKYNASVTISTPATEETGAGPVGWWRLDDGTGTTTKDSSSNNSTGTLTAPTWLPESQCVSGKCLQFNGQNSKVSMGNISTLDFNATQSFTVESWIKTAGSSTLAGIIGTKKNNGGSGTAGYMLFVNTSLALQFTISDGSTQLGATGAVGVGTDNKWHHVVGVVDRTQQKVFLYLDGNLIATSASIASVGSLSNSVAYTIGTSPGAANPFVGSIDDQRVYSYARTQTQIRADFLDSGSRIGSAATIGTNIQKYLSDGLVAYYKMDESSWVNDCSTASVLDSSGNGSNGKACPNSTGPTGGTNGLFGNGGIFAAASSQYVQVANSNNLTSINTAGSISTWIKYTTNDGTNLRVIMDVAATGSNGLVFYAQADPTLAPGNKICLQYGKGSGSTQVACSTTAPTPGIWYHAVATWNSGGAKLYLNGKLEGTNTTPPAITVGTANSFIGASAGTSRFLDGTLDDLRVYNRTLSADEVRMLYNWAPGPVGWWKFDEATGTTANDSSGNGNGNTGTLIGNVSWVTGKYGKGVSLPGAVNSWISVTDNDVLDWIGDLTIEAWVNPASNPTQAQYFFIKGNPFNANGRGYAVYYQNGAINAIYNDTSSVAACSTISYSAGDISNSWNHFTFEFKRSTNTIEIYKNGVLVKAGPVLCTGGTFNVATVLGFGGNTAVNNYNGKFDDIRFYNYSRNPQQIQEDMQGAPYAAEAGTSASSSKPSTPVGLWRFDEGFGLTANNSGNAGSAINGQLSGMSSPATSTSGWQLTGKFNKALAFDGINDFVQVADNAALDMVGDMSISAWVKTTNANGTNAVVTKSGASNATIPYMLYTSVGKPTLLMGDGTSFVTVQSPDTINDGNWHHMAATVQSNSISIYVDGALKKTGTFTVGGVRQSNSNVLNIGESANFASVFYTGQLDAVKIFNGALTQDEVRQDMNEMASVNYGAGTVEGTSFVSGAGSDPIADWELNERTGTTANDSSGNANTGVISGGPTWVTGKFGSALNFDGVNALVAVADTNSLELTGDLTLQGWFKTTGTGTAASIINKQAVSTVVRPYQLFLNNNQVVLRLGNGTTAIDVTTTNTYNDNNWHFAVGVVSGTTMNVYVDGMLQATGTFSGGSRQSDNNSLTLGQTYAGQLDAIKMYNYARTQDQIAFDYNRGAPVGWWRMDECQGTTLKDSSGNGNNGTLTIGASGTQTAAGDCSTMATSWGNGATGKLNGSVNFDGTDDYVTMGDPANGTLDFGTGDFSVSYWMKYSTLTGHNQVTKRPGGTGAGWAFGLNIPTAIAFRIDDGTNSRETQCGPQFSSIFDGNWHHVVGVFTRSSNLSCYLDGRLIGTSSISTVTGSVSNSSSFNLNTFNNLTSAATVQSNGQLDEVRVFNYSLTATQVKLLYNGGYSVFYGPSSGPP